MIGICRQFLFADQEDSAFGVCEDENGNILVPVMTVDKDLRGLQKIQDKIKVARMSKNIGLENIVVLIDADNAQYSKIKAVLDEISARGRIVVKRAYGDWKDEKLKKWEQELKRLAIKPEQQFAYTIGKNATDISLTIGTMDLLNTKIYDAFVLVSSDSDYTPLAIRLRESGVSVLGIGEKKTPEPFRNACDEFIFTENLEPASNVITTRECKIDTDDTQEDDGNTIDYIHTLLKKASDNYQDGEGWVNVCSAGAYIKRVKPDFDIKAYGYSKLTDLVKNFSDKYKYKTYPGKGTVTIFSYKVKCG